MGGRFVHLMGATDKNLAQRWLMNQMRRIHGKDFKVMALGDSENDAQMLADADYPVLIRSEKHGFPNIKTKDRSTERLALVQAAGTRRSGESFHNNLFKGLADGRFLPNREL